MTIVTISRQLASQGDEVAKALSLKLGWEIITRDNLITDILVKVANKQELYMLTESPKAFLCKTQDDITFIEYIKNYLVEMSKTKSAILVGFGSQLMFTDNKDVLKIRIISPKSSRIEKLKRQYKVLEIDATTIIETSDRKQNRFIKTVFGVINISDNSYYDLVLDTKAFSVQEYAQSITTLVREHEKNRELELENENIVVRCNQTNKYAFKNLEEIEFAEILDSYHIEWIYEPKTFPIEWDTEGNIKFAFTPDFYLTKLDLYIELTIMNQKYVSLKNKKAKKLRELYPGINVRVVYKKDFLALIERFREMGY